MRQIVLDTETTGLETQQGHRITEIGCLEIIDRRANGPTFHHYLNPDREMDEAAREITGLSREFLAAQPRFPEVVDRFIDFISGAELIIHNAAFDVGFLDYELSRLPGEKRRINSIAGQVTDTLELARERHPGARNSLDALCKRYGNRQFSARSARSSSGRRAISGSLPPHDRRTEGLNAGIRTSWAGSD